MAPLRAVLQKSLSKSRIGEEDQECLPDGRCGILLMLQFIVDLKNPHPLTSCISCLVRTNILLQVGREKELSDQWKVWHLFQCPCIAFSVCRMGCFAETIMILDQ